MSKRVLPLSQVYKFLEPGPVVLLTTKDAKKSNVMTMSWHTMMDFVPPIVGCIVSDRNYSFQLLKKTKECVINIPTEEFLKKTVAMGNCSGKKVDKFEKYHLQEESGSMVKAPLLPECYVNLECKVIDMRMAKKYNLFIVQVVKAWIRPQKTPRMIHHAGAGVFIIDGKKVKLASKAK